MPRLLLLFLMALSLMVAPFLQGGMTFLPVLSGGTPPPAEEETHEEVGELASLHDEQGATPDPPRVVKQQQPPPLHPPASLAPPRGAFVNLPLPPLRLQV